MKLFNHTAMAGLSRVFSPFSLANSKVHPAIWLVGLLLAVFSMPLHAATLSYGGQIGLPIGDGMTGSAYGNNAYVVVGSYGHILRSTDGRHWAVVKDSSFINTNYDSVTFAQGIFVAIADNGNIITSTDGANWALQTSGTTSRLSKIAYLNGKFFVTGSAGTLLTSANGTNWSVQSLGAGNSLGFITYGAGKYLITAYTSSGGAILSSTTGTGSWSTLHLSVTENNPVNFVGYLNGKFWSFTSDALMWTSTDGATWTQFTSATLPYPNQVFGGIYTNNTLYFYGSDTNGTYGAIFTSTDGSTFSEYLPKTFTDVVNSFLYANGLFVETGNGGWATSTDAQHWQYPAGDFTGVAYNGTNYVAVGYVFTDGYIATSPDWINWSNTTPARIQALYGVAYGKGKFIAVGSSGNGLPTSPIVISTNGYNWTVTNSGSTDNFYSIATDTNGTWVMVGDNGHIIRSTDNGVSWSTVTSGTANGLNAVAYINSQFVAVGYAGTVIYSANGATWTDASYSDANSIIMSITYGSGGYVLAGVDGNYDSFYLKRSSLTSGSWAAPTTPPPSINYTYYGGLFVTYANGVYLGFYNDTNNEGYLLTSTDGNTWTQNDLHSTPFIFGATYANGSFHLAGYYNYLGRATFNNSAPVIQSATKLYSTNTTLVFANSDFNGAAVYSDADGDPLSKIQIHTLPLASAGTLQLYGVAIQADQEISGANLAGITFVPGTNSGATATFTWLASDGIASSASATYTLSTATPNTAPVFVGASTNLLVAENAGATSVASLLHVSDTDSGQTETWSQSVAPAHGTLAFTSATAASGSANIAPGGSITYTPAANYSGADSFTVQVSDGNGGTATRIIAVTVNPPTGITSATSANGTYGSAFTYTITASNSPTSFGATGLPTGLSLNSGTGLISGTPMQSGVYSVTISATNATSSASATLALTVAKVNLTVSGIIASNKVYDASTTATLSFTGATLNGVVNSDSISLNITGVSATFADANVGVSKTVTISGLALAGITATNYTLTQPAATANITPAPAVVTLNRSVQLYNGSAKTVSVTTTPSSLPLSVTYNGSGTAPSSIGAYTVIATVTNPNYSGSATNNLYIAVAPQFLNVRTNGTSIMMTWSSMAQVNYQVQYTPSLQPVTWTDFNGPVSATATNTVTLDVIDRTLLMRLYRVKLILE